MTGYLQAVKAGQHCQLKKWNQYKTQMARTTVTLKKMFLSISWLILFKLKILYWTFSNEYLQFILNCGFSNAGLWCYLESGDICHCVLIFTHGFIMKKIIDMLVNRHVGFSHREPSSLLINFRAEENFKYISFKELCKQMACPQPNILYNNLWHMDETSPLKHLVRNHKRKCSFSFSLLVYNKTLHNLTFRLCVSYTKMPHNQALVFSTHLALRLLVMLFPLQDIWPLLHPWHRVWARCPSQTCPVEYLMAGCLWNSCGLFVPAPHPALVDSVSIVRLRGLCLALSVPHWRRCWSRESSHTTSAYSVEASFAYLPIISLYTPASLHLVTQE